MVTAVAAAPAVSPACVHIWQIDPPNGPSSPARCVRCDSRREFANSIQEDRRVNNSDLFTNRRASARQVWSNEDGEDAVRSMFRR